MSITFEDIERAKYIIKEQAQLYGKAFYVFNLNGTITVLDAEDYWNRVLAEDANTDTI